MKRERYEKPDVEKIEFDVVNDIITTSTNNDDDLYSNDEYEAGGN